MLGKRLINSNDAGGGGQVCRNIVDDYKPFNGGIALYQLNGDATDESGNYNGTASNVTYGTGKFGQSGVFNGSSSYVNCQDPTENMTTANYSVSFWVKTTSSSNSYLISKYLTDGLDSTDIFRVMNLSNGTIRFRTSTSGGGSARDINSTSNINDGNWHHILFTVTPSTSKLYIDGTQEGGDSTIYTAVAPSTVTRNVTIGRHDGGDNYFNGSIDQVRIFDRALNATEVSELYVEQVCYAVCASDEPDVFQDGSGVALYQLNWDGSDMSGNYDGTATDVSFVNGKIDSAGSFNGSSSYIDTNYTLPASSTYSVSCWFNTSSTNTQEFIIADFDSSGSGNTVRFTLGFVSTNNFYINIGNGSSSYSNYTISGSAYRDGNWHNIVTVWDGTNVKLYADGNTTPIANLTSSVSAGTLGTSSLIIGRPGDHNSSYFDGKVDQVRIFNKAISASEVTTLYNETACVKTCTTDTPQLVSDCIAYYKLDGNADDSNGTATVYDGTPTNVSWTQGRLGSAGGFNGSSSYINLNSAVLPASVFSVSFWVNVNSLVNEWVFSQYTGGVTGRFVFNITSTGGFQINVSSTNSLSTTNIPAITIGNWHHVVAVKDGSNGWTLYSDGSPHSTWNNSENIITNQNTILGGDDSVTSNNLDGKFDQVRIYDRVITAEEVTTLYNEVACPSGLNFNTVLWTGDGSADRAIGGVGFQPDFVWIKSRDDGTHWHDLFDSVRGAGERLFSNTTNAESYYSESLKSFNTDGFTIGIDTDVNANGDGIVAWCWKAGGDAVTNADGTITSDVSANVDAGFSIVKYTGTGVNGNYGHGLSSAPELIITKNIDWSTPDWFVYHKDLGTNGYLRLNQTTAEQTASTLFSSTPTSTVVNIGNDSGINRSNGDRQIAYCFTSIAGYQKIGSYTGNGGSNSVTTGFEPRFVLIKQTSSSGQNWIIHDNVRVNSNPRNKYLMPSSSAAESSASTTNAVNFLSNGFELIGTGGATNASGGTYIYLAIK